MRLYVLYEEMNPVNLPQNMVILSFLTPEAEEKMAKQFSGKLFYGRQEMNAVREQARLLYIDLVARIGATTCHGKTLRQALATSDGSTLWWYHGISEKQVERDQTFNQILEIVAISTLFECVKATELVFVGGSDSIPSVFGKGYNVLSDKKRKFNWQQSPMRALLSRIKGFYTAIRDHFAVKHCPLPDINPDIVFQGFWDWSVQLTKDNKLIDAYFKELPDTAKLQSYQCAWFLWFSPHAKPGTKNRSLGDVLSAAKGHKQLIFIQQFLKSKDILRAMFDFRPLFQYLGFACQWEFRAIFRQNGLDFWPLFDQKLLYSFCDSSIPTLTLVDLACQRAFTKYKPSFSFHFLELFLFSRGYYSGGKKGNLATKHCAIQHASYNKEKTFLVLDPEREYIGKPDGFPIPKPDYIFAMGELGQEILHNGGFPTERVFLTGSPRYDHIKISNKKPQQLLDKKAFNIVIVATLNCTLDFEMVQAVSLAAAGFNSVNLYLRSHPFARIEDLPKFKFYSKYVKSTQGTLEADLAMADLVVFTYSTVAEEALLQGIPILQWLPRGFNGSVFRDLPIIPIASTVSELQEKIQQIILNPDLFQPTRDVQEMILKKCFYKGDGQAAWRIIEILKVLKGSSVQKNEIE